MAVQYLDKRGLTYFWSQLKNYFQAKLVSGTNIKTINNTSLLGSGNISISGGGSSQETFFGTVGSGMQDGVLVGLYDPNSGVVTIHFACRSASNIATTATLFTIPSTYRPSAAKTIPMMIYTSNSQAGYHGTLSTAGVLTQGWSGSARGVFGSGSYTI